ncbi:MAG: hypothetical protein P8M17_05880 [Saprospiraceae bacterium]|mgnify:FL=1|nr:hypothetical protein [Saprospiraceae bacterium]MDG1434353.1 hypothetical protein [Saprospiraceae bacterium]MDG2418500.1 hypothetical protein [Saprospiraceae bacterium]
MKNLILFLTFFSTLFLACNSDSNSKNTINDIPDDKLWAIFLGDFKNAIGKNDLQDIVKLIDFPLDGNFFKTNTGKGLSKNGVLKNYGKIIGTTVRERVIIAKTDEWSERKINSRDDSKKFGVPVGETMKVLTLNFVFNKGEEDQTESAQIFYFAKVKGDYKWCAMEIVG